MHVPSVPGIDLNEFPRVASDLEGDQDLSLCVPPRKVHLWIKPEVFGKIAHSFCPPGAPEGALATYLSWDHFTSAVVGGLAMLKPGAGTTQDRIQRVALTNSLQEINETLRRYASDEGHKLVDVPVSKKNMDNLNWAVEQIGVAADVFFDRKDGDTGDALAAAKLGVETAYYSRWKLQAQPIEDKPVSSRV